MGVRSVLFALVFVVVGIGISGFGVWDYQNQREDINEAVEVEGTVETADVRDRGGVDEGDKYRPYIKYTYSYEGQQYTSRNVYPGMHQRTFDAREEAAEVVSRYSPGEPVTVYVNHEDPSRSFLINDIQPVRSFVVIGSGVGFVVVGIVLMRH